jgi:hypothetical protein
MKFTLRSRKKAEIIPRLFLQPVRGFNKAVDLPAIFSGTGKKSVQKQFDG